MELLFTLVLTAVVLAFIEPYYDRVVRDGSLRSLPQGMTNAFWLVFGAALWLFLVWFLFHFRF